ncbi:hypothetical protein FC831_10450 [Clostridium botulinum]|nr:hypothetical protein [Clostridium botulinum]
MEYISEEEFLKQPVEVQKVLIDWWKPSTGDLFIDISKIDSDADIVYCVPINNKHFENYNGEIHYKIDSIPLLSEGQLRKCIEDKTGGKVILTYNLLNNILIKVVKGNDIHNNALETICRYPIDRKSNVLNAYWKVACEIANEMC